jgi:NhaP-type Na+/H+ or K+/H+ antiporter
MKLLSLSLLVGKPFDVLQNFQAYPGSGMFVGLIIRVSPGSAIQDSVSFNYQFFFNLLLPPIILASGYELHQVDTLRSPV